MSDAREEFPSFLVRPINEIGEAIKEGHYKGYYAIITPERVKLPTVTVPKKVYVVAPNKTLGQTEYVDFLKEHSLKPCVDGSAYLCGLMAQVPEADMPTKLYDKCIVAAEPDNEKAVIIGKHSLRHFLCVDRSNSGRTLSLARIDGKWEGFWAFLAQEI